MRRIMKTKLTFITILLLVLGAANIYAADYYVAQNAAGMATGVSCANATGISYYTGSWSGKVSAGDTLHLCGTITSPLIIGASGLQSNPITVKFENGAKFSKPAWGTGSAAAIYSVSKNYITIDGGTNGIIENTNNGTALGTKQDTNAIYVARSSNWTIKNLTVKTMYVRTPDSDDSNTYGKGIYIIASNTIVLSDLKVSDIYHGIQAYASGSSADGLTIQNTSISRVSAGIAVSLNSAHNYTNVSIDNVKIFDLNVWDGCWNNCASWHHNDGIHTWGNYGSGANKIQITIKNSTIGGDFGAHTTALIALTDYTTDANIYNNLLYSTAQGPTNGYIGLHTYSSGTVNIYNNTIKGPIAGSGGGMGVYIGASGVWTTNIKNNIFSTMSIGINDSGADATIVSDYNDFFNIPNIGKIGNTYYSTIASWKALTYDAHSITDDPKFVSSSDFRLQSDSPAINAGTDLSAYFTTDKDGTKRTIWSIGAYERVPAQSTLFVTSANGTTTSNPSGINCGSTCYANFGAEASVTLNAVPKSGYTFAGWSGGGCSGTGTCTVSMASAQVVTANYAVPTATYYLAISKKVAEAGTITTSDNTINCGSTCTAKYSAGKKVSLNLAVNSGYKFTGWTGACKGQGTTCTVSMTASTSTRAYFVITK